MVPTGWQDVASIAQGEPDWRSPQRAVSLYYGITGRNVVMPWVIHYRLENFEHLRNVDKSFRHCLHIMKCLGGILQMVESTTCGRQISGIDGR